MSDIKVTTDSGKFIAGARTDSGDHVGDLYVYHNGTNSFVENETGILYVTNKANANMVLGTNNSARLTIESDGTIVTSGAFQPGGNVTAGGNLALSATNTLFFDGNGGHTFITEYAANKMQLQAGGQGSVILDGTNSGTIRMGIGDSSPGSPLDVKSGEAANTANFNSTSGATNITFESSGSLIGQMEFVSSGTSQIVTRTSATLALGSNNEKTLYITDDDRVGIGTASPVRALSVSYGAAKTSTSTAYAMSIQSNESSGQAALQFYAVGAASAADRKFQIQSTEVGVANAGIIEFQPDGGDVRFPNGILFGSDTAAANELDDYEEGAINTTISGITATTRSVTGTYTKIGRTVFIQAYIIISGKSGGTGNPYIALPFVPSDSGVVASTLGADIHKNTSISNLVYFGLYGANAQIYANNGNGGYIDEGDWADGVVGFTVTYNT